MSYNPRPVAKRRGSGQATGNPPTRALHMHQTRTPCMHHSTAHATEVAPKDQQSTASTDAKAGIAPMRVQIFGSRGAGQRPGSARKHAPTPQRWNVKLQRVYQVPALGPACVYRPTTTSLCHTHSDPSLRATLQHTPRIYQTAQIGTNPVI